MLWYTRQAAACQRRARLKVVVLHGGSPYKRNRHRSVRHAWRVVNVHEIPRGGEGESQRQPHGNAGKPE